MKIEQHFPSLALHLISALAFTMSAPVMAAPNGPTFTVNTTFDGTSPGACANNVPRGCSLREAIIEANHFPGANATINVPSGTYKLTIFPSGTDDETTGDLNLTANMTIVGAGAASTIIDANQIDRAFSVDSVSTSVTISGVTVRNGKASDYGGGIQNEGTLALNNSVVSNNTSRDGGGIYTSFVLSVINSVISENNSSDTAGFGGGGIFIIDGNLTLTNSTVSNNRTAAYGGGIMLDGGTTATLFNSTISNNSSIRDGGGILASTELNAYFSTIAGNLADSNATGAGNGGGIKGYGAVNLKDTLLGENYAGANPDDCNGPINAQGYDIIEYAPAGCIVALSGTGRLVSPILVDSLKNNGGPTPTRAPLPTSPAINLIPAGTDGCGTTNNVDQRGSPRPSGNACDVGAYEGSLPDTLFGVNLIRNGDAEGSAGSPAAAVVGMPYWTGSAAIIPYGAVGGFPSLTDPGPTDRGFNFFAGGVTASASVTQARNLQAIGALIDTGHVKYDLSGYFGGFANQDDNAVMFVHFLDNNGQFISQSPNVGQVYAADRGGNTGLIGPSSCTKCSASGMVPPNTRSIKVFLDITRVGNAGSYNDGYADNLSLVLTPPFLTQSDCLFNWAERTYPSFFAPPGAVSNTLAPYYYRYYPQTNAYLGTSSADNHVYYLGPLSNNTLLDVGTLSSWSSTAGCQ